MPYNGKEIICPWDYDPCTPLVGSGSACTTCAIRAMREENERIRSMVATWLATDRVDPYVAKGLLQDICDILG